MSSPFVKPITTRLKLPSGDWIDVKRELCVGDQKRLEAAGFRRVQRKEPTTGKYTTELEIDWETYELARAAVWIVAWSHTDDGIAKPATYESLAALTPEAFEEIQDAISAHVAAIEQEKKLKASPSASPVTTPS